MTWLAISHYSKWYWSLTLHTLHLVTMRFTSRIRVVIICIKQYTNYNWSDLKMTKPQTLLFRRQAVPCSWTIPVGLHCLHTATRALRTSYGLLHYLYENMCSCAFYGCRPVAFFSIPVKLIIHLIERRRRLARRWPVPGGWGLSSSCLL